jgi:hypothetical protein
MSGLLQGPEFWSQKTKDAGGFLRTILENVKQHPKENITWLGNIAQTVLEVSGHALRQVKERKKREK